MHTISGAKYENQWAGGERFKTAMFVAAARECVLLVERFKTAMFVCMHL
jgi:hypothetical protein